MSKIPPAINRLRAERLAGLIAEDEVVAQAMSCTSGYEPSVQKVHVLFAEGLLSAEEHESNLDAIMAEIARPLQVEAPKARLASIFRPMSREELRRAEDAARQKAIALASETRRAMGGILSPTAKGRGVVAALGTRGSVIAAAPKERQNVVLAEKVADIGSVPEGRTEVGGSDDRAAVVKASVQEITEAFLTSKIPLETAREKIKEIRSGNARLPCRLRTATGTILGCHGDPIKQGTCQLCGSKGYVTAVAVSVPRPVLDCTAEEVTLTGWADSGQPIELFSANGHAALKLAIKQVESGSMVRVQVNAGAILTFCERVKGECSTCKSRGFILDENDKRQECQHCPDPSCLSCNGMGHHILRNGSRSECDRCKGSGTLPKTRTTRVWFGDDPKGPKGGGALGLDKAQKAAEQALGPSGWKQTVVTICPICKGKGKDCDGCKDGKRFMGVLHFALTATVGHEVNRSALRQEARPLPDAPVVPSRSEDKWINRGSAIAAANVNAKGGVLMRSGGIPEDRSVVKFRVQEARDGWMAARGAAEKRSQQ